ncbi:hypothetical protein OG552_10465 [Streptomyces sp. NBC_01476]|uniref:hypothetical protein n=1 Tax=Streptomyces sp. NBC_01476 TaxID=2903881 RepID=UPI002E34BF1E|nr:hypothetical protein [Streptomyces sp. NBC_01476]
MTETTALANPALPVPSPAQTTITVVVARGQTINDEQRNRICDWLRANGVDPVNVPQGAPLTIEQAGDGPRAIHFWSFYTNETGQKESRVGGDQAIQVERTRLLVADLPPEPGPTSGKATA